ncbi:uncharacterized protein LOC117100238 [Anneissia japonica]|uniref:uncharacterized protein LOC117100238 n=1 Tax=Anneissia japonica TaxID=1529436 RepID=UPI001425564F|nr:uncharacterized protein LOC117100238 [Anneissia japonica]
MRLQWKIRFMMYYVLLFIYGAKSYYLSWNKTASSKSVYSATGIFHMPECAIDGDDYTILIHPISGGSSCFHSGGGSQEWLKIDLQKSYRITRVTVINRVEPGSTVHKRLEGAEIRISSTSSLGIADDDSKKCGEPVTMASTILSPIIDRTCQPPITGRYVILWQPTKTEFLNICEVRIYDEHKTGASPITNKLNPVGVWQLSWSCMLYETKMITTVGNGDCKDEVSKTVLLDTFENSFNDNEMDAFTVAFYIYPNINTEGNILKIWEAQDCLRIEQTYSNGLLYKSEVTVFYGGQQVTRAHVLLPDTWTFLALTFDGNELLTKLWRNGEIASIGNIPDQNFGFQISHTEIELGSSGQLNTLLAALQLYDRVLDEAEIKAARDRPLTNWIFDKKGALFEKLVPTRSLAGQRLYQGVVGSGVKCSQMCLETRCCDAFSFNTKDHVCTLFSHHVTMEESFKFIYSYRMILWNIKSFIGCSN